MALKRRWKGLAAFPGILVYKAYLPRGFRCLGESGLTSLGLGTAETETASLGHFDCAHCCRCFCIYLVCFYDRVTPILTGSAFPCCPLLYSLPCRNPGHPHHKRIMKITITTPANPIKNLTKSSCIQSLYGGGGGSRTRVQNTFPSASYSNSFYLSQFTAYPMVNATTGSTFCKITVPCGPWHT